ncbi:hypothetical protein [Flavobacterium orientale]|uniref:CBM-cenC domain-containing protein n=1 Tax=Flavobacterium orientale TaxID=1756020 RepID=A0A917DDA0_9FLAO|nr:hypothetical protein [Flavobacterium orientale]GGD30715.1 hypothetical protein GCM10011343_21080 [Flavobacterium orientale]
MKVSNLLNFKRLLVVILIVVGSQQIMAQQPTDVKVFKNNKGWSIGDISQTAVLFDEIRVRFEVKKSLNSGRHYYVARIENISNRKISFGARLTDKNPTNTQFSVSLEPGQVKEWGEHLTADAVTIYFLASKPK